MKHYHIDLTELSKLWESGWLVEDLAKRYGCTNTYIYWLRKKYGIANRSRSQSTEPPPPSVAEDLLSQDSLALSPWVAERAEVFRRQKERDGEPDRVHVAVTRFVMTSPRRRMARFA